jgi:hypothetical protein
VTARFVPGDPVRVAQREHSGHVRTPRYIRGMLGVVERVCGAFKNPEAMAYCRRDEEPVPLYRVRFSQRAVWPDYTGAPSDTLDVELYEHWLEPGVRMP